MLIQQEGAIHRVLLSLSGVEACRSWPFRHSIRELFLANTYRERGLGANCLANLQRGVQSGPCMEGGAICNTTS
jgi:hypothetical protein